MHGKNELCRKITELYPEIGACGIDIEVEVDKLEKVWIVDLRKDSHGRKHHVEISDARTAWKGSKVWHWAWKSPSCGRISRANNCSRK